jgi:hypothetical protein
MTPAQQFLRQARARACKKGHKLTRFTTNGRGQEARCVACFAHLLCEPEARAMTGLVLRVECLAMQQPVIARRFNTTTQERPADVAPNPDPQQ